MAKLNDRSIIPDRWDVVIVGGGPVGLATAIEARKHSLSVVVLDRQVGDIDKACGEGLMPAGVTWLERNGILQKLTSRDCRRFVGIRYVSEDGTVADGRLPDLGGLGLRRLALSRAMRERAKEVGVELVEGALVEGVKRGEGSEGSKGFERPEEIAVRTARGDLFRSRVLVGADGLHSKVRRDAGLEVSTGGATRFGMRRHFRVKPWSEFVEVYFGPGVEAYVTPVGDENVGIAFLWSPELNQARRYEEFLALFPELEGRVRGMECTSTARGAGPLFQRASRPVADRVALIGDAAGYVDAITGEGLTLGFHSAELLGATLPSALARGADIESFRAYESGHRKMFDRYAWLTNSLLAVARRPSLRRAILKLLAVAPGLFEAALSEAMPSTAA